MSKILICDDDVGLALNLSAALRAEKHVVDVINDGDVFFDQVQFSDYDLIVLDWELPSCKGVDLCSTFRSKGGTTPVLMLTGKTAPADIEQGLDAGADDYVTKPFEMNVLKARLRALIRRTGTQAKVANDIQLSGVTLSADKRTVSYEGKDISLQPLEFSVLEFLMRNCGVVYSVDDLLKKVWGADAGVSSESVYSCVRKLRKKLDEGGGRELIKSKHGSGYWFSASA